MTTIDTTPLVIAERFRGPPKSANGGYACGVIAARLGEAGAEGAAVSLRSPPPLDAPMEVRPDEDGGLVVHHGETLVATARPTPLELEVPAAPSADAARRAMGASPAHWTDVNSLLPGRRGVHPICFCCGDELAIDEGLRVQPGPLDRDSAAALWTPDPAFAGPDGALAPEHVWTALDCPGEFAWYERDEDGSVRGNALLARLNAVLHAPVPVGEPCIVLGWRLEDAGRKYEAGTALFDTSGRLLARARALWVRFDPERFAAAAP